MGALSPGAARLLVVVALLVLWEIGARLWGDPAFVCPPSAIPGALRQLLADPKIVDAILLTIFELVCAFVASVAIGSAIGLAVGLNGFSRDAILPIVLLLYVVPQATFLPLFVTAFGIGPLGKIAFGITHGIFPIIVTTVGGVQNVQSGLVSAARSMGASRAQILREVVFPQLVPSLFTGMRLGMTAVLLGVLLAEFYVSMAGIGFYTRQFAQTFAPPKLFALIAVLAAIAVTLNESCRAAERHFSRWRSA